MQRRTVPSPPQANTSSAPSSSARSHLRRAPASPSAPRTRAGRVDARGLEHAAQLRQPAAEPLLRRARRPRPSCAPPAPGAARARCGRGREPCGDARRAAGEQQHEERADADQRRPPATSSGWCMPRYIRDIATKTGSSDRERPRRDARAAVRDRASQQQHEPGVHRDRRRGVAGRDSSRRRAGPRAGARAGARAGRPATSRGRSPTRRRGRTRRSAAIRQRRMERADERDQRRRGPAGPARRRPPSRRDDTSVRNGVRSATRSSTNALVGVGPIPPTASEHVGDEQAEQDGDGDERHEAGDQRSDEHGRGVAPRRSRRRNAPRGLPARACEHGTTPSVRQQSSTVSLL